MFGQFSDAVAQASTRAYVVLVLVALLDAILPIVPSETAVITAGVLASSGDLILPLVIACAAVGAFLGDNTVYLLGHRFGDRARRRFLSGRCGATAYGWAERQLATRGGELIVVGRFIPGRRTAVSLSAGQPVSRGLGSSASTPSQRSSGRRTEALLGYFGGKAFEHSPWKGLLLAFGAALTVTVATGPLRRREQHSQLTQRRCSCPPSWLPRKDFRPLAATHRTGQPRRDRPRQPLPPRGHRTRARHQRRKV